MSNSVTVFSNGVADFVRSYPVKKGEECEISIPVKKSHVGDVLASLNLFGDVKLDSPPSFSPSNDLESDLKVDTANVLYDLATKLSGSKVTVSLYATEKATKGTLMGVHTQELVSDQLQSYEYSLVVLTEDDKVVRFPFEEVQHLCFVDETVQSEINKALQRNFQKVKPNSTFVNLTVLGGDKDSEALVQYTVPAAAWKISYRLTKNGEKYNLKGLAIVDNNTEEDWKDVIVSVVTGEPITFSTDLAESKTPSRSHVNIVNDKAVGAVEVDRGVRAKSRGMATRAMSLCSAAPAAASMECVDDNYSMMQCAGGGGLESIGASAIVADSEIKEVGDFAVFRSKNPLTIASNRSAVIPVFDSELTETRNVLHFNPNNNQSRAYRSLHFKNETDHSLGRGVCTVYFDGIYSGSCVLPAAKKGEDNLMPYALETGVRVMKNLYETENKLISIKVSGGVLLSKNLSRQKYKYSFDNSKPEDFEVYLDHDCYIRHNVTVDAFIDKEKLSTERELASGLRFKFNAQASEVTEVEVVETIVNEQRIVLSVGHLDWIVNTYVVNGPLKDVDKVETLINLSKKISEVNEKIEKAGERLTKLEAKQNRLRENLKVGGNDEKRANWTTELDECEDKITKIEENDIPAHEAELESLNHKLEDALKTLVVDWNN